MATDPHPHSGRRQHFHRNRRGHDRRGERRPPPAPQAQESTAQAEHVDVDQIVKEIKARISQRHGIDLSAQQIQELAARRLEAILDPRTVKPGLLDQLRRAAGASADIARAEPSDAYTFEDHTIYDTHNGLLRAIRRLLAPILKLFFNPNPISAALNAQVRVNRDAARREAERERTQSEWNALHYTVLQRLVTEVSRVSLEMQSLSLRVESLATRADFTERRIRGLEAPPLAAPPQSPRMLDVPAGGGAPPPPRASTDVAATGADGQSDGARRRRRRRRGRRGNLPGGETVAGASSPQAQADASDADDDAFDDGPDGDAGDSPDSPDSRDGADDVPGPHMGTSPPSETASPAPFAAAAEPPAPVTTSPEPPPADTPSPVASPAPPPASEPPDA